MASIIKDRTLICTCCKGEFEINLPMELNLFSKKCEQFTELHSDCVEEPKYGVTVDELTKHFKEIGDAFKASCDTCEHNKFLNDAGSGLSLDCYGCTDYSKYEHQKISELK